MQTITVMKAKLLKKLEENKKEHVEIYKVALEAWKEKVTKALREALTDAETGKRYITEFDIEEPECHKKDYEAMIEMIQWHDGTTIELQPYEFNHYIRDRWDWSRSFLKMSSSYTSSSSSSINELIKTKLKGYE